MNILLSDWNRSPIQKRDEAKHIFYNLCKFKSKGLNYIKDLYKVNDRFDEMYKQDHNLACHKGCSACCHQLIGCTKLELNMILEYIDNLKEESKNNMKKMINENLIDFKNWINEMLKTSTSGGPVDITKFAKDRYKGRPCIFLINDECSIYPVRPVICRAVKIEVNDNSKLAARPMYNIMSTFLAKEEDIRCGGNGKTGPIRLWLFLKGIDNIKKD